MKNRRIIDADIATTFRMSDSLKDQLLGLGFKVLPSAAVAPGRDKRPRRDGSQRKPLQEPQRGRGGSAGQGARTSPPHPRGPASANVEMDLARAYAIRAQTEKDERITAEREKQEAARLKREAKAKIVELLKDKTLNAEDAELVRHFDYNGKIRRVHVTEAQLKSLNVGDIGVVQLDGRYLLVDSAVAREVHALLPSLLALLVDPGASVAEDPCADPKFVVPDDLVW